MEQSLRRRLRAGEPSAFAELFDEHAAAVHRHGLRLTGDRAAAEDVFSTTFLHAWRRRERIDIDGGSLRPWLLAIATNVVRNVNRGRRRLGGLLRRLPTRDVVPDFADEVAGRVDDAATLAWIAKALAALRPQEREVIALCVWEELDYATAAQVLGIPVGSPAVLFVFVPLPEFTGLHVSQMEGYFCGARTVEAAVVPLGGGWWSVRPRGPAGEYQVSIFADSTAGGDMAATVRWRTPTDEPLPEPSARLGLIADHDGSPDSYGLDLTIVNLAASPERSSARITVTAGNGESMSFDATRSGAACDGAGEVRFDGPADLARQAAALGDFPFTLRVDLVLDGVTYTATATYPDDAIEGSEPYVALDFDPALR